MVRAWPFNFSTFQPLNLSGAAQTAAQGAAESSNIHPNIYSKTNTEGSDPFVPISQPPRSPSLYN